MYSKFRALQNHFIDSGILLAWRSCMKKVALLGAALGLSAVMASCGLIPPIKVDNPLGLSGAVLSAPLDAAGASIRPQVAGQGNATVSATFADLTTAIPFTPSLFNVQLAITSASISAGCAALGTNTSIAVTVSNMTVAVSDSTTAVPPVVRNVTANVPTFSFNISNTGAISELNATALLFAIPNLSTAISIISTAPTPNSVKVDATVATSPALSGCTVGLTFGAGSGEIKL
jgi:hypothetical protein